MGIAGDIDQQVAQQAVHQPRRERFLAGLRRAAHLLERDFQLDAQGNMLFRKAEYWQEITHHTLADAWAKTDAHVLSMFGELDFEVFDAFSMSEIARIVNSHHPGHGTFVTLPGTDHGMIHVGSMEKAQELRGQPAYNDYYLNHFDYTIVTELQRWIERVMKLG